MPSHCVPRKRSHKPLASLSALCTILALAGLNAVASHRAARTARTTSRAATANNTSGHIHSRQPVPRTHVTVPANRSRIPHARPAPRIAICIAGHLRTFAHPSVTHSLRRHLVNPLRRVNGSLHFFFHFSTTDSVDRGSPVFQPFRPASFSSFQPSSDCVPPACATRTASKIQCPFALTRASECMNQIRQFERKTARPFDWVYRTRPDVLLLSDVSIPSRLRADTVYTNQHHPGTSAHVFSSLRARFPTFPRPRSVRPVGDHVVVCARRVADIVFEAPRGFGHCDVFNLSRGTVNSEVVLTYWLARSRIRFDNRPWFWLLLRPDGPDCSRVRFIDARNVPRNRLMTRFCRRFKRDCALPFYV